MCCSVRQYFDVFVDQEANLTWDLETDTLTKARNLYLAKKVGLPIPKTIIGRGPMFAAFDRTVNGALGRAIRDEL